MTETSELTEAQDYESIGQLSPEAEAVVSSQKAWGGIASEPPVAEQPIDQLESHDFTRWNNRANRQTLAVTDDDSFAEDFYAPGNHPADVPPMAAYQQTPTAATDPVPL